jgi:hypothetical protein
MGEWSNISLSAYLKKIGIRIRDSIIFKRFLEILVKKKFDIVKPVIPTTPLEVIDVAVVVARAKEIYESKPHSRSIGSVCCYDLMRIDKDLDHLKKAPFSLSNFQWVYARTTYPAVGLFLADKSTAFARHMTNVENIPEIVLDIIRYRNLSVTYSDYLTVNTKVGGGEKMGTDEVKSEYRYHSLFFNLIYFPSSGSSTYISPFGDKMSEEYAKEYLVTDIYEVSKEMQYIPYVVDTRDVMIFFFPFFFVYCQKEKKERYIQLAFRRLQMTREVLKYVLKYCGYYIAQIRSLRYSRSLIYSIDILGWNLSDNYAQGNAQFEVLFQICAFTFQVFPEVAYYRHVRFIRVLGIVVALLACLMVRSTGQNARVWEERLPLSRDADSGRIDLISEGEY